MTWDWTYRTWLLLLPLCDYYHYYGHYDYYDYESLTCMWAAVLRVHQGCEHVNDGLWYFRQTPWLWKVHNNWIEGNAARWLFPPHKHSLPFSSSFCSSEAAGRTETWTLRRHCSSCSSHSAVCVSTDDEDVLCVCVCVRERERERERDQTTNKRFLVQIRLQYKYSNTHWVHETVSYIQRR